MYTEGVVVSRRWGEGVGVSPCFPDRRQELSSFLAPLDQRV